MAIVHRFTLDTFTRSLEAHVLPRSGDTKMQARHFWDAELEGRAPRTEGDVDALVDALVDSYGELHSTNEGIPDLVPIRRVLGDFLDSADANAAIARHRPVPTPRAERNARTRTLAGRRGLSGVWRTYWLIGALVTVAAIALAATSGAAENIAVASIIAPGFLLILAGIVSARSRR